MREDLPTADLRKKLSVVDSIEQLSSGKREVICFTIVMIVDQTSLEIQKLL